MSKVEPTKIIVPCRGCKKDVYVTVPFVGDIFCDECKLIIQKKEIFNVLEKVVSEKRKGT